MPADPDALCDRAGEVIRHVALGDLAAGDAIVAEQLETAAGRVDGGAAAFWYAVAALEHSRGDLGAQQLAAERCLQVARGIDSAGWASNALSVRAMALSRGRDVHGALSDLARAEIELERCHDPGLRNWGHVGLGYVYLHMRLYELAEPHMVQAVQLRGASPMPLEVSALIDMINLSELYLAWADELDRVPGYATGGEVARHRSRGRRWAREAVREARQRHLDDWLPVCQVLQASAVAGDHPRLVQPYLRRVLDQPGHHAGTVVRAGTALVRALRACGQVEQAHAVAEATVDRLSGQVVDWSVEVAARDLLVTLEHDLGRPGSTNALAYVRLLGESSWQQRLRTLQGARTALDVERLQRDGDAERLIARQDPLTGLGNRRALDEAMVAAGSPAGHRPHSLVLLDLDDFKGVNDAYGHTVGDGVLCAVADVLRANARDGDVLVRLGGDEFVVFAVGAGPAVADELVQRLERGIDGIDWDALAAGLRVTATVGVASTGDHDGAPAPGRGLGDLVQAADAEMYRHKRRSREPT